ncbi:hypothetical protein GNZ12_33730 [Paraburkholderia sp. 1N]|uniref:Uncharacterized protein n=1 Tax=Paraburkholderia solitsugae TaxID=2675748 RepID=A0ABX2BZV5_9BURK|nr:hypothetical protein [Paraburkholderia solitsugae]NPT46199.1 hypothetical protein [Paraburkholderia solitsugae]
MKTDFHRTAALRAGVSADPRGKPSKMKMNFFLMSFYVNILSFILITVVAPEGPFRDNRRTGSLA